jgi:hypothetical protein
MQAVQLSVSDEVKALADSLGLLITDLKAGKGVAAVAADVLPSLLSGISQYQSLGADAKAVDNQAYILRVVLLALEPSAPVAGA